MLDTQQHMHFLHISKTGGSAFKHALQLYPPSPDFYLHLHAHFIRLEDIPVGQKVFFCLREPHTRFISGFYSRFREGRPRYLLPWSPAEKTAFQIFQSPNQLATALSSEDLERKKQAHFAMQHIGHIHTSYLDWFQSIAYLKSRLKDIFYIGYQEQLSSDFDALKNRLDCDAQAHLPNNAIAAHQMPPSFDKTLSAVAKDNLKKWYQPDYAFLSFCKTLRF